MQGCDSGEVTGGETGEELQRKGYLVSAKVSNWTASECSDGESACDEFVGRVWVEECTNFVGDDGDKGVDGCGGVQGVAGNGGNALCLVRLEERYSHLCCDALCGCCSDRAAGVWFDWGV